MTENTFETFDFSDTVAEESQEVEENSTDMGFDDDTSGAASSKDIEEGIKEAAEGEETKPKQTKPKEAKESKEPKQEEEYHTVNIDGKEEKLTLEQLRNYAQQSKAAQDRFRKAAEEKKKLSEFLRAAKTNPDSLLKELGYDPYEFAEKLLSKRIEETSLSPEEKEARQQKEELAKYKKEREELFKKAKQKQIQQYKQQQAADLEGKVLEAMQSVNFDVNDPQEKLHTLSEAMRHLYAWKVKQMQQGKKAEVTKDLVSDIMHKIKGSRKNVIKQYVSKLTADELVDYLGKDGTEKIRKHLLGKVKKNPVNTNHSANTSRTNTEKKSRYKTDYKSLEKGWDDIIGK